VLAGRGVRSLLHFAFVLDPMYDEAEMRDIDLGGTANVLRAVENAAIPHLLATSSTTAYGALADNPVPLTEEAPTRATPEFNYAHDKRLMDEMLRSFAVAHPSLKVCIVRPCIVLGPTVANYIAASMLAQPVTALLDGADPSLQFIHEDDLVRLIATCVERQAAGVFNAVGVGTVTTTQAARLQG
jgi:UDP-glucose 4-epimerase